ncbi:cuticle protein 16.8 [Trichonephila clavata]|uniref:Cuticle protein 16.8 n=1 Tax=Trichonephila clavata TaxID=2740835 RepID=A0A8X6EY68_TRICU|nr:cuticle protein 16.8 [Trichonephila clavata]
MISQAFVLAALAVTAFASIHVPIHHHAPQPYKFGYSIKDHHGEQHREESGDGGHAVRGSYGFTDARGIRRQVHYVADHGGFRAEVKTNEPGTANQNPAAVHLISDAPYAHGGYAGSAGLDMEVLDMLDMESWICWIWRSWKCRIWRLWPRLWRKWSWHPWWIRICPIWFLNKLCDIFS